MTLQSKFGNYSFECTKTDSTIRVIHKYVLQKGNYPKTDIADLKEFSTKILNIQNSKAILKKE